MTIDFELIDNSGLALEEFQDACLRALEECGIVAEGYAQKACPVSKYYEHKEGGTLRNSITHQVQPSELAVYIGTNSEYGAYVELGTGKYYPGGRQTPWVYQDAEGNWHMTNGQRAQPYLKPAIADHAQKYKGIVNKEMRGGK